MSIKHRIKLRSYRGRGTSSAELRSTGPKLRPEEGSDESSALDGESIRRDVPADEMITIRYEEHDEKEYAEHCRKFFKGEVE
tara:strand:+ start:242 stop:487 length:246 start_codon:yes stop_codon:yes gene_type:complete